MGYFEHKSMDMTTVRVLKLFHNECEEYSESLHIARVGAKVAIYSPKYGWGGASNALKQNLSHLGCDNPKLPLYCCTALTRTHVAL